MVSYEPFYKVKHIETIRDIIDLAARDYPERPAFEIKRADGEHFNITYTEYRDDINALSNAFLSKEMSGKSVAVISDNCYEYALTYISVICSGGVMVPIDKELDIADINGILETSEAKMLFIDEKAISRLGADKFGDIELYSWRNGSRPENVKDFAELLGTGKEMVKKGDNPWLTVKHDPDKLCTLLFTSGTTGLSKGVMLCQRNFTFEVMAAMGVLKIYPEDCGISLLPFHHTFESSIILMFAPYCGAKVTFCEGFKYVLRNMAEFTPSIFVAVPLVVETVHKRILKKVKQRKNGEKIFRIGIRLCKIANKLHINLSKIIFKEIQETFGGNMRMIICGGAAIDPEILDDFNAFGIKIIFGYGLTECAPLCIINNDRNNAIHSIGVPRPGVDVKIDNPDSDGIGEVCVRGGMVMLGYYKNQEETDRVMDSEGFFHTGDLGYCDKKGFYHLTGRCKNLILTSNGKNIFPEELEYHLDRNDYVAASMVEAAEDNRGNTIVHAQIFPDFAEIKESLGKNPDEKELHDIIAKVVEDVNEHLPHFKHIKSFSIRETDFVRTTAQKIKREVNKQTN